MTLHIGGMAVKSLYSKYTKCNKNIHCSRLGFVEERRRLREGEGGVASTLPQVHPNKILHFSSLTSLTVYNITVTCRAVGNVLLTQKK